MRVKLGLLLTFAAQSLFAAGLETPAQTARAAGMGGAYVAQADDPSAIFYNPGGLALMKKPKGIAAGATLTALNESLYQGLPPGLGAGTTGEQETPMSTIPYAFVTLPLGNRIVSGVGVYTPVRWQTKWASPETFAGRFRATSSQLQTYDVTTTFGLKVTDTLGLGGGAIYRSSQISASRHLGSIFGGTLRDVADVQMKTDFESSLGWNFGLLHRPTQGFAWGATYRSAFDTEYAGVGTLTQIPTGNTQFDTLVRSSFPFDQDLPIASALEFPSEATVGVAIGSKPLLFEVDATRTEWSGVQSLDFVFQTQATLNAQYRMNFEDTMSYRAGFRFQFPTGPVLRVGYAMEESPMPLETTGALLPDSNRNTYTAGLGLDWLDVSLAWTTYEQRVVTTNVDAVNGNYRANSWSVLITATK
jgi:long-chain fatty acid transport protein